ncbi:hypothetical protein CEUSTIGMA_g1507.t1 [Chlamydomonas eustigma]|uniref:CCB4 n=1 Tax=Chlamydomonas eustigma TaxID=1157962 RepID=A0A250WTA6_9CHLO|nr:hypothetical protein CEUSTIGMA_g1507.t1 [Chlamydomonas eustigma]|eukprot:GAX74057.1 hypothetical protein CEUSTIGMA_g1507.t1 [Chlamydomonas eustigma]
MRSSILSANNSAAIRSVQVKFSCHNRGVRGSIARESRRNLAIFAKQGGLGDEDMDVAVFRFTLGIPGFEDRLIPRVVAGIGAALLAVNHILSIGVQFAPDIAQARAEVLCGILVLVLGSVPDIEERLREAQPGRGRQSTASSITGAKNAFALDKKLPDKVKQELAWSSFALLKNTNSCGMLFFQGGKAIMARGAMGESVVTSTSDTQASLDNITKDMDNVSTQIPELNAVLSGQSGQLWLQDRQALERAGFSSLLSVPQGAQCLLAQRVAMGSEAGLLVVFSERPRSLSDRERSWVGSIGQKLSSCF